MSVAALAPARRRPPKRDLLEVSEVTGVWARGNNDTKAGWVQIREMNGVVALDATYASLGLTPNEARGLAKRLYRLARRIEAREIERATGK